MNNEEKSKDLESMFKELLDKSLQNMEEERDRLLGLCEKELIELEHQFGIHAISILNGVEPVSITFPVQQFPEKISSLNLDKDPFVEGTLMGIKGQYLILDTGVINLRKYSGYQIALGYT